MLGIIESLNISHLQPAFLIYEAVKQKPTRYEKVIAVDLSSVYWLSGVWHKPEWYNKMKQTMQFLMVTATRTIRY